MTEPQWAPASASRDSGSAEAFLALLRREIGRFFCLRCLAAALAQSLGDVRGHLAVYGERGMIARVTARCSRCLRTQTVVRLRRSAARRA